MASQLNRNTPGTSGESTTKLKVWTKNELDELKGKKDWLVYGDSVYNVRPFLPHHPGGDLLIKHVLYTDVTDHLGRFHPKYVTEEKLPNFLMGKIDVSTFPKDFMRSRT
jgi:cytochrome b involved in lipid metabolism